MAKPVILFLAANPDGTNPVALGEECAAIERELQATPGRDDFDLRSKWAVTVDDLMRALAEVRPTIVHFAGHGNTTGIVLHGQDGAAHTVTADALSRMIASTGASPRLVVLNACYTDAQAQPLSDLVGCAVGMSGRISDDAARAFSVAFYRALGYRYSAYFAFAQALATLAGHGLDHDALPHCITRANVDANAIVLSSGNATRAPSPPPASTAAPAAAQPPVHVTSTNSSGNTVGAIHGGTVTVTAGARGRS